MKKGEKKTQNEMKKELKVKNLIYNLVAKHILQLKWIKLLSCKNLNYEKSINLHKLI